ncbi:MAG: 2,3-diphosphoglycerate synthetase [Actinobacteria bacterium]|nr:MAG: 2,3-diphosphoglycerate synthetase [Actinomycetota bacterium]
MRTLALIDGEHYPSTVRDALVELPYEFVGAFMAGGTEKLRGEPDYGVPLHADLEGALRELEPELVLDLSDEPVLGPAARFRIASRVLAAGIPYAGADFRLEPPELEAFPLPSLSVFATGKRVGKTAVSAHVARLLSRDRDVVAVAMGRGGPEVLEVAESPPSLDELLARSRGGSHAASDYLEIAAVAGVVTIGCRRCGGGLAGAVATSNVQAGADLAVQRGADFVVFDGSGAAIPPVATGKRVLVTSTYDPPALVTGYLNAYRILLADLVVVTMADASTPHGALAEAIREVKPEVAVVAVGFRPRPLAPIEGKRVAYFTTAAPSAHERLAADLAEYGAEVVHVSGNLADRPALLRELATVDADVYLTEIKAAGIDVVAEAGVKRGVEIALAANDLVQLPGQPELDAEALALADAARVEPVGT